MVYHYILLWTPRCLKWTPYFKVQLKNPCCWGSLMMNIQTLPIHVEMDQPAWLLLCQLAPWKHSLHSSSEKLEKLTNSILRTYFIPTRNHVVMTPFSLKCSCSLVLVFVLYDSMYSLLECLKCHLFNRPLNFC